MEQEFQELLNKFQTGQKPSGEDFARLITLCFNAIDMNEHKNDNAPHVYGGRFEWRYNETTDSLDLMVLDE